MRKTALTMAIGMILAVAPTVAQDGRATLEAAAKAMGATNLTSIEYSGTGTNAAFGQAYGPTDPWPTFKVTSYTASVTYAPAAMRVELQRTNPDGQVRGGGGLPLVAPQRQIQVVAGRAAWNVANNNPTAALQTVRDRQLALWSTPHGVIKGALANNGSVNGRVVTFSAPGGINVEATLGSDNLVASVKTMNTAPVVGDTITETTYSEYQDFSGVKFPRRIVQKQGGFPTLDLTITEVKTNAVAPIETPQALLQTLASPGVTAVNVTPTKMADGVYYLTGGSHHSLAVEFRDFVVVFEAPQNDERTMAVLEATKKTIPNKPIRYVVNSHNHFDHLGGVRAAMAEGITIITHEANKEYYERIAKMPFTIAPDRLAKAPKAAVVEGVTGGKRVITDGTQTLEILHLPSMHTSTMLVGYLPKQKMLFEVDVWNAPPLPAAGAAPPPAPPVNPASLEFLENIEKMKLDVEQILPGHGPRAASIKDLRVSVGKAGGTN